MDVTEIREARNYALRLPTQKEKLLIFRLLEEVERLRQGLWDCVAISGSDTDGQRTPDALVYPDIVDYAKREVQQLRDDYDEALAECEVHN